MHQVRCPRPHWGSLQCSPDPLAVFKGPYSNGRERKAEGRGRERRTGSGMEKGGKWRGEGGTEREGGGGAAREKRIEEGRDGRLTAEQ